MNRFNTIYYKFLSEKKKYSINFDTTEISIGDLKKEIIRKRSMEKVPEKFELIFYDENNSEIRDENYKVEPLKLLLVKRVPLYKLSSTFIETINDPTEISSLRFQDFAINIKKEPTSSITITDPLEKIQNKITLEQIEKRFGCKLCHRTDTYPSLLLCCGETICDVCAKLTENKECPYCGEMFKGSMPNQKEAELKTRLLSILNKQQEMIMLRNTNQAMEENLKLTEAEEKENQKSSAQPPARLPALIPIEGGNPQGIIQNAPTVQMPMVSNLKMQFFDNARFFIIKSSNKENVELSQKHSEWATTVNNQKKLNEAFLSSYVILIFSVNRSGNFQGFAVMTSYISDKVSNIWQNESSVKLGGSFGVHWLTMCELPFNKVKNIVNPMNNNESVTKSRDTQELTKEIGLLICNLCNEQEKIERNYKASPQENPEVLSRIVEEIKQNKESNMTHIIT